MSQKFTPKDDAPKASKPAAVDADPFGDDLPFN
jgi:hypothetical protein